ncbi:hypothetical protein L6452_06667 [Arctium lappa]|uniref:Uncharacterized protein n=1 Tax=Arctium lappa TaxID=4217 RepID=A0ACB9EJU5_ARCLA|nr:hypothetical protein L6452_06667 [Arctium lappa]
MHMKMSRVLLRFDFQTSDCKPICEQDWIFSTKERINGCCVFVKILSLKRCKLLKLPHFKRDRGSNGWPMGYFAVEARAKSFSSELCLRGSRL